MNDDRDDAAADMKKRIDGGRRVVDIKRQSHR